MAFLLLFYFVSQKFINELSCIIKQISVSYIHGVKVGVFVLFVFLVNYNKQFYFIFGPGGRKVTWPAAWPTVLLSQFLYTDSHSTPSLYRLFCCLSSCTPTVTAHRHCTDSSAVSVPVHRQSQQTVTVPTVLLSQFLYTDSHYDSLHSWSCQHIYCDYTKTLDISLIWNTLQNRLSSKCTVSLQMLVSVNLHWHYGNYAPSVQRRCIEICIVLCFWYNYWLGRMERDLLGNIA